MFYVRYDVCFWVWVVSEVEDVVVGLFFMVIKFFCEIYRVVLFWFSDFNVFVYIYYVLVFLFQLFQYDDDIFECVNDLFFWDNIICLLILFFDIV